MSGSKGHIVSSTLWDITQNIATCEEGIWISKSLKSGIQGFGIRNTAEGFLNPTNDWNQNPRFTDKGRNQVPGIRNPRCGIHSSRLSWIFLLWAKKKKQGSRISKVKSLRQTQAVKGDASSRHSFEKYPCGLQLTENILTGFQLQLFQVQWCLYKQGHLRFKIGWSSTWRISGKSGINYEFSTS